MKTFMIVAGTLLIAGCGASDGSTSAQAVLETLPTPSTSVPVVIGTLPMPSTSVGTVELVANTASAVDPAVEAIMADLSPSDIAELGGVDCATEVAHIAAAGERYHQRVGTNPETLADLIPDLRVEPVLWSFDDDLDQVVPSVGSPCPDFFGAMERESDGRVCMINKRTLETAVEATFAQTGILPLDQQQLVDDGMIRELHGDFDVVDGNVTVAEGSECGQLIEEYEAQAALDAAAPLDDQAACDVQRRTLEVAVEAHYAQFGEIPASEAALVETGMLRAEFADFDLTADATVIVAPGSICD